ncbi:hypothetical protein [Methanosarcina barkeri]|nr:hypothetical protein [Methanosarcina barkeri]
MAWPITSGDYVVGDPKSPVAVVTLASDYRNLNLKKLRHLRNLFYGKFWN